MVSTYGNNQAIASQNHCAAWGRMHKPSGSYPGIVWMHGIGTTATYFLTSEDGLADKLTKDGRPVASCDPGQLWGNATAQGRVSSLRTYGQSTWGFAAGTVDLIGFSMGTAAVLNWAKANPTLVGKIALILPAVDVQDIHANNRGNHAATIATAWGGSAPSDANNPADNTADLSAFDHAIWYSTDDPVCVQSVVTTYGTAVGAEMHSLGAVGHTSTGINSDEVVDFFNA